MDILFKPRVEAMEQMAQNCMDISQLKNQRELKIASKWHVWKPKLSEPKGWIFFSISIECHKMYFWKYVKEMSQVLLFVEFILDIDRKILR